MAKSKAAPEENQEEVATPAPAVEIIRGRMPLAIVALIRFKEPADVTDAVLAAKYRTTNGKISDIRKLRNFGYMTSEEGLVFTEDELHDAANLADQLSGTDADDVNAMIKDLVVGSPEQIAARDEVRKASRKPRGVAVADSSATEGSEDVESLDEMEVGEDLFDGDEDLSDLIE